MGWLNVGWAYRIKITASVDKVPAYWPYGLIINCGECLYTEDVFWLTIQAAGDDIRITLADGVTEVPRGVREFDRFQRTGLIYFKGEGLSTLVDTDFYIYFGNADVSDYADDDSLGMRNVWSNYHLFASTMADSNSTTVKNEVQDQYQGIKVNVNDPYENTVGKIGKSQSFDGVNDYLNLGSINPSGKDLSFLAWVYMDTVDAEMHPVFDISTSNLTIMSYQNKWSFYGVVTSVSPVLAGVYQFLAVTFEYASGNGRIYLNGVLDNLGSGGRPSSGTLRIGYSTSRPYFKGKLDELQILTNKVLTLEEIQVIYNNQLDQSTFWTFGSVEERGYVGYFTGYTKYLYDVPASGINVYAYRSDTGEYMGNTVSSEDGYFFINTMHPGPHFIVAVDSYNEPFYNDLVKGKVIPESYF